MGNLFSGQKQTAEEIKQLRQAREEYQNYLSKIQTNTNTDVNGKRLTPESGRAILSQVQKGYDWLQKHPNANLSEIMASYDATSVEIKRIMGADGPKREFFNIVTAIPVIADKFKVDKRINAEQYEKLKALATQEEKWYSKNSNTATPVDISQENIKVNDTIVTILPEKEVRDLFNGELEKTKNLAPSDLTSLITKAEADIEAKKATQVDVKEGADVVFSTAMKVFLGSIIVAFCIVAGSLAANFAISRPPAYRILYFLYGCIPFFAPLVYMYTLYKRIADGPISYYGILPLSVEPGITRLGKLLWYPFYYVPDSKAVESFDTFKASVEAIKG